MSVSVIIPARNEEKWLCQTIDNVLKTASGEIEVIVVDYGGNGIRYESKPVKYIEFDENKGERVAMNAAVKISQMTHILRIDAHCDFSPKGWDEMLEEVTGERDMTQAVLTAVDKQWKRLPGHRYERCRLLSNYEAKWEKPNRDHTKDKIVPNMSSTGCGFMIRRDFYNEIGGADESYPVMGAIGEEFSVKTWLNGGKVQTRTDVIIGHIFDTGGYDTAGVLEARQRLVEDFGDRYGEIRAKFTDLDWSIDLKPTAVQSEERRTVIVNRTDETETKDDKGIVIRKEIRRYKYIWVDDGTESDLTEDQIREKYKDKAVFVGGDILMRNEAGEMIEMKGISNET